MAQVSDTNSRSSLGRTASTFLIAADEPRIHAAAFELRDTGATVEPVQADLATKNGVGQLYAALKNRPVDALLANAGHGLGRGFLDQDFEQACDVVETNVMGTIDRISNDMRARNRGKILITGSIDAFALRNELKDTEVAVSCLMPGPTDTKFFRRADVLDTSVGQAKKDDPAMVAKTGFDAMMSGDGEVVGGWKNKLKQRSPTLLRPAC